MRAAILPRQNPAGWIDPTGERRVVGMGWHPDIRDYRDRTHETDSIQQIVGATRYLGKARAKLPTAVTDENTRFCPPIEDQGALGACTAHAVVGMMEYLQRRSKRKHVDLSRLFLYRVTRRLLGWTGDTGAFIRTTIKAAAVFGCPPESQWPYDLQNFDQEPEAFLYAYAANFSALNYARIDQPDLSGGDRLRELRRSLAAGFPVAFGFPVYNSLTDAADIPFPDPDVDVLRGGHAVLAVGYDDAHRTADGRAMPSILIRNSWGTTWGEDGYGWLPYAYVEEGLAEDLWSIFKQEWIDLAQFN